MNLAKGRVLLKTTIGFSPGNNLSTKEVMPAAGHAKRMQGLFKAWGKKIRIHAGEEKVLKQITARQQARKRSRLRETVAKEAREIQELARKHAHSAMLRMAEIAQNSQNETAAIAATALLMDRAYGKANQTTINAHLDANGKPTDVSEKELNTRIEETLKRIDALTGGKAKAPARKEQPIDLRKLDRDPNSTPLN